MVSQLIINLNHHGTEPLKNSHGQLHFFSYMKSNGSCSWNCVGKVDVATTDYIGCQGCVAEGILNPCTLGYYFQQHISNSSDIF